MVTMNRLRIKMHLKGDTVSPLKGRYLPVDNSTAALGCQDLLAHGHLPMGKNYFFLRALCVSVVN